MLLLIFVLQCVATCMAALTHACMLRPLGHELELTGNKDCMSVGYGVAHTLDYLVSSLVRPAVVYSAYTCVLHDALTNRRCHMCSNQIRSDNYTMTLKGFP